MGIALKYSLSVARQSARDGHFSSQAVVLLLTCPFNVIHKDIIIFARVSLSLVEDKTLVCSNNNVHD